MASPDSRQAAAGTPLDAERARLRAAGLTDDEISKIFVGRELGASTQQAGYSAGAPGQSPMTGALANLSAVWAHARGIIPTVAAQILTVRNSSVPASERLAAGISLLVKAALLLVFAYVVSLEMIQFRLATDRARAETCSARQKVLLETQTLGPNEQWDRANQKYMEECTQ